MFLKRKGVIGASNLEVKAKNFTELYSVMNLLNIGITAEDYTNGSEYQMKKYGSTFESSLIIDPITAGAGAGTGMTAHVITSITSLTDKLYVLGSVTNSHVGILKLKDDGTREMSTLVPTTAAPFAFTNLKAIRRLNDSQFVVGYGQSIRVIDARNGIAVPFITAGAEQTKADAAIKVIADKIKAAITGGAATNEDAKDAIAEGDRVFYDSWW